MFVETVLVVLFFSCSIVQTLGRDFGGGLMLGGCGLLIDFVGLRIINGKVVSIEVDLVSFEELLVSLEEFNVFNVVLV